MSAKNKIWLVGASVSIVVLGAIEAFPPQEFWLLVLVFPVKLANMVPVLLAYVVLFPTSMEKGEFLASPVGRAVLYAVGASLITAWWYCIANIAVFVSYVHGRIRTTQQSA